MLKTSQVKQNFQQQKGKQTEIAIFFITIYYLMINDVLIMTYTILKAIPLLQYRINKQKQLLLNIKNNKGL